MTSRTKDEQLKENPLWWLASVHPQLAAGARDAYAKQGRGCLVVEANRQPGTTKAEWCAAEDIPLEPVTATLRRMVADYPERQFVMVLTLEGQQYSIEAKVRLEQPLFEESGSDAIN